MGTYIADVQHAANDDRTRSSSHTADRRRFDVSELPATQATEYVDGWSASTPDEVYFERRAGKTYVVAAGGSGR